MSKLTIGSLFSGIGGFEYIASLYGIEPVWASEIEEAPIRITKRHFPNMKHYGDITKMNGAEIEPVDIISGGSPCFPAGTMVLTKNGYVNIEDIKVGDIVLTHKNRWRKVTAVGNRESETIILKGNCTLETTRNHPIYSILSKDDYDIKYGWVNAEDMLNRVWATPMVDFDSFLGESLLNIIYHDNDYPYGKKSILTQRLFYESMGEYTELDYSASGDMKLIHYKDSVSNKVDYHGWYTVDSIIPTNQIKTVYNLSVEEDESYIADSIVVHNCQSLSVAGHQDGIKKKCPVCSTLLPIDFSDDACPKCGAEIEFTRSGLFMEQIRLIKEMRKATNDEFPKVIVWENVSGSLSSNNGDDFNCVLSEFLGLLGEKLPTLRPEKWTNAGEIVADKGSLAWRLFDAQYWGVPQRRRRIYLVLDFTGQRAGEILFKSESLRRHTPQSEVPWKRIARKIESSIGTTDSKCGEHGSDEVTIGFDGYNADTTGNVSSTLGVNCGTSTGRNGVVVYDKSDTDNQEVYGICSMGSNCMKSDNPDSGIYKADVSKTLDTSGTNPTCNQGGNVVVEPVYCIQGNCIDRADTAGCNGKGWKEDVAYTLTTIDRPAVAYAVHENGDAAVWLSDHAQALTTGGGKHGQGYSAVLIETDDPQCAAFLGKQSESARGIGYDEKVSPTLVAGEPPQVAVYDQVPFAESDFVGFNEGKFATLKASGGHIGGGSETLVAGFAYQQGPGVKNFPYYEESAPTLTCSQHTGVLIENHPNDSRVRISDDNICQTLSARMGTGGGNVPLLMEDDVAVSATVGGFNGHKQEEVAQTLLSRDYKDSQIVAKKSIVRRLTVIECERLQGFPDNWTEGESDTARYKALGNSVALPCVNYVMSGIVDVLDPID